MPLKQTMTQILAPSSDVVFNYSPQPVGYISTFAQIEGMNLILTFMAIQTILLVVILYFCIPGRKE